MVSIKQLASATLCPNQTSIRTTPLTSSNVFAAIRRCVLFNVTAHPSQARVRRLCFKKLGAAVVSNMAIAVFDDFAIPTGALTLWLLASKDALFF